MNLLTCLYSYPAGTLLPYGYPAGKGKDSYLLHLKGKGIPEIDMYANGWVNDLPLPYPAHCHPYPARSVGRPGSGRVGPG
jgi:hypothetical protein